MLTKQVEDFISGQISWWPLELRVIILVGIQHIPTLGLLKLLKVINC